MVREFWNRSDAYTLSDCGAIEDQVTAHHTASNVSDASAKSMLAGTDGCAGSGYIIDGGLAGALASRELSVSDLDAAVSRLFTQRFKLGMFDPPSASIYTTYGTEHIASVRSRSTAADAAAQGSVLLKNAGGVLPLRPLASWRSVAVVGPHAVTQRDLLGDFYGDVRLGWWREGARRYSPHNPIPPNSLTGFLSGRKQPLDARRGLRTHVWRGSGGHAGRNRLWWRCCYHCARRGHQRL